MEHTIKTFEDACAALGTTPEKELPEAAIQLLTPDEIAYRKLKVITKALNEGWQPDWTDSNWKYYPLFDLDESVKQPAGSGLSYCEYDGARSTSTVGSRLCYKSRELAEYAATTFSVLFEQYFLIR